MSITTTELIELLKSVELGVSGRPREIDLILNGEFIKVRSISINSTGDGVAGAELCLEVEGEGNTEDHCKLQAYEKLKEDVKKNLEYVNELPFGHPKRKYQSDLLKGLLILMDDNEFDAQHPED